MIYFDILMYFFYPLQFKSLNFNQWKLKCFKQNQTFSEEVKNQNFMSLIFNPNQVWIVKESWSDFKGVKSWGDFQPPQKNSWLLSLFF